MDRQEIIKALSTLGEPQDGQRWQDYSRLGFNSGDASRLISLVKDKEGEFYESEEDDYWIPLHAWRALKPMMPTGLELLIGSFHQVYEDEWAQDEIPEVVAAAHNKAIAPLVTFIMGTDNVLEARFLAVDSLVQVAKAYGSLVAKVTLSLANCLKKSPAAEKKLNGYLIAQLIELKAADAHQSVKAAFAEERVDISICGDLEDVEIGLGLRTERDTPRPDYHAQDRTDEDGDDTPRIEPVRRETPKVGRNEPCSCGSGKKFKRCCG